MPNQSGTNQNEVLIGSSSDDSIHGAAGDDLILGRSGDDTLRGGAGDDILLGGSGEDVLRGGTGDDALLGGSGNDTLAGGRGDDLIVGGRGDDVLRGGIGDDTLIGGRGDDTFVFAAGSQHDIVLDFHAGGSVDKIVLRNLGLTSLADVFAVGQDTSVGFVLQVGSDRLTLIGVSSSELTAEDFVFQNAGTNADPVAVDDTGSVSEAGSVSIPAAAGLLANDTDADSDALIVSAVNGVAAGVGSTILGTNGGTFIVYSDGSYDFAAGSDFEDLAIGETRTTTIEYTISDGNGGTATATLLITVTGQNDVPVITSAPTSGGVTELADNAPGENTDTLSATGTIAFEDVDLTDGHTVNVTASSAIDSATFAATAVRGTLTAAIGDASTGDGVGQIDWTFEVSDGALDDLAAGQTITQVFTMTVDDGNGGTASQDVTITLIGTNDAPEISVGSGDTSSADLTETDSGLSAAGSLSVADVDLTDVVTVSVASVATAGSGGTGGITDTQFLDMFSVDAGPVIDATGTAGTISWSFDSGSEAFDFLLDGEELVLSFTITATDDSDNSLTDDQVVSITINGSADGPVITTGVAVDGYILGATVFGDANENGVLDPGEVSTVTDSSGNFVLTDAVGPLVLTGGIDISTGLDFQGQLRAPNGSSAITSVSTLVAELIDQGQTQEDAEMLVRDGLGLAPTIDFLNVDPVAATLANDADGMAFMAALTQVQNTVAQAASVLEGAGAPSFDGASIVVFSEFAALLATGPVDLNSATEIEQLLQSSAVSAGVSGTAVDNTAAGAAEIISQTNSAVDIALASGAMDVEFLTDLAQINVVAQEQISPELEAAVQIGTSAAMDTVVDDYTDQALDDAIDAAEDQVGDVDGGVEGTSGDDSLTGTINAEAISGLAGNDTIVGLPGSDVLVGGADNDQLFGAAGNDTLVGGFGDDTLDGDDGL
nr:VCBS domain-containing protein [Paracoccaceae bacterium]